MEDKKMTVEEAYKYFNKHFLMEICPQAQVDILELKRLRDKIVKMEELDDAFDKLEESLDPKAKHKTRKRRINSFLKIAKEFSNFYYPTEQQLYEEIVPKILKEMDKQGGDNVKSST